MLNAILVFLAMTIKDLLGTGVIMFLGKGRAKLAGLCDALGDYAALFCIGASAVEITRHGWLTGWSLETLIGIGLGSFLGTVIGARLTARIKGVPDE